MVMYNTQILLSTYIILFFSIPLGYLAGTYPLYILAKKSNMKNPKYMFIPIVNGAKLFNLADYSTGIYIISLILMFIPILNIVPAILSAIVSYKICQKFGLSTFVSILSIFFPLFVYWYIVLDNNVTFNGTLKEEFKAYKEI